MQMQERHRKTGKDIKKHSAAAEEELAAVEAKLMEEALRLPNDTHPDAPVGEENTLLFESEGEKSELKENHLEIGKQFGLLEMERASKITGSKFAVLKREAVLLE